MSFITMFAKGGRYHPRLALPSGGMLANWDMSGGSGQSVADRSGSAHPLQLGATTGADASDPVFTATGLTFDGATKYCTVPTIASLPVPFTILAVFQVTGSGPRGLVACGGSSVAFYVSATNKLELDKQNVALVGAGASTVTGAAFLGAVTYDGSAWKIYKGSTLDGSGTNAQTMSASTPLVGAAPSAFFFNGTIYHVLIYSRILSGTEVAAAYASLKATWAGRGVSI